MSKRPLAVPPVELPQILEIAIDDYHRWAEKYFRNVERRNAVTAPLYHYTSMAGFEGILKSESIWFTDYRHLNDPRELLHGLEIAKRMLQRRMKAGGFASFVFGFIDDLLNERNFGRALEFFIASFSRNRDELGQWRAYADNARGVAIGFSPNLFRPVDAANKDPRLNVFVGPILYDDAQTRQRNAKALDVAEKMAADALVYARHYLKQTQIGLEFIRNLARSVIASPLIWNALTCKHGAYRREEEVRLVMLGDKRRFRGKISSRMRGSESVPYVPYKIDLKTSGSIAEVVIGPAAPKGAEDDVRRLLSSRGVKARIRRSRIPYRA